MEIFRRIAKLKEEDPSLGRRMDKKFRLGDVSRIPSVNLKVRMDLRLRLCDIIVISSTNFLTKQTILHTVECQNPN